MNLFIDTNILFNDPYFESPKIRLLLQCAKRKGWEVFLPEICRLELIQKTFEGWEKINTKIKAEEKKLGAILQFSTYSYQEITSAKKIKETIEQKINLALSKVDVKLIPIPEVEHKKVVLKAIEKEAPFKSDGTGYRDYLIFQAIKKKLEVSSVNGIILSKNKKDFGETHCLYESLKNELPEDRDLDVYTNVDELILEKFNDLNTQVKLTITSPFLYGNLDLAKWILEEVSKEIDNDDLISAFFNNCPKSSAYISQVRDIKSIAITDEYEELNEGTFIEINVDLKTKITFNIDSDDVPDNEELSDFCDFSRAPFVGDITILSDEDISLTLLLEVDKVNGKVRDSDIKSICTGYGSIDVL